MISKYNSFSLDLLLEKAINESFLYYSPSVRKALNRIKSNDIASSLLDSEGTDVKPDMTFIDLGKEGGNAGGEILCIGTPKEIIKNKTSYTAQFLKEEYR